MDGMNQLRLEGVIHLGAQAANVNVHDVGPAVPGHVPNFSRDQVAGQRLALAPGQQRQQHKLLGGKPQVLAAPGRLVANEIQLHVGDSERFCVIGRGPPQNRNEPELIIPKRRTA